MYKPTINIGQMSIDNIRRLQPGQWVKTSDSDVGLSLGRFWGVKPSGTVVVAWQGNARGHSKYWEYQNALRHYANNY
jgi:hypothetical protein